MQKGENLTEAKIAIRQARAAMVAERAFQERLDRIRWEEEVLNPELERLKMRIGQGILPVIEVAK